MSFDRGLIGELRRRRVIRVALAYVAIGLGVIYAADAIFNNLPVPNWAATLVIVLVGLGLPVIIVLAWAFDLTPDGVVRTRSAPDGDDVAAPEPGSADPVSPALRRELGPLSVAVLPLETLGESGSAAIGEGIHAGVLTRLANISELSVIARTSVRRYRSSEKPISEIGRELGVAWILEGEVQEGPRDIHIAVRLVDAAADRQVWSRTYEEELSAENLFELQADITTRIADSLKVELTGGERELVARKPTASLDAHRLWAEGRMLLDRRSEADMRGAIESFERALDLDPEYALAWVGLADAHGLLHAYGYVEAHAALPQAELALRRALELDPQCAEAYAGLGRLLGGRGEKGQAERMIARAIELEPSYADAHSWASVGAYLAGRREDALAAALRAVALNPLSPEAVFNLGVSYFITRDHRNALQEARRIREIAPGYVGGVFLEGLILYETGRFDEAAVALVDVEVPWAGAGPRAVLALARLATGAEDRARTLLESIESDGDGFAAALVHAALGDTDKALDGLLSHGLQDPARGIWETIAIRYFFSRIWDLLRDDPRYDELRARLDR